MHLWSGKNKLKVSSCPGVLILIDRVRDVSDGGRGLKEGLAHNAAFAIGADGVITMDGALRACMVLISDNHAVVFQRLRAEHSAASRDNAVATAGRRIGDGCFQSRLYVRKASRKPLVEEVFFGAYSEVRAATIRD